MTASPLAAPTTQADETVSFALSRQARLLDKSFPLTFWLLAPAHLHVEHVSAPIVVSAHVLLHVSSPPRVLSLLAVQLVAVHLDGLFAVPLSFDVTHELIASRPLPSFIFVPDAKGTFFYAIQ